MVPVRRGVQRLALKVTWPHPEGLHEALALRTWAGDGAVRLVAALPSDGLLLLERLDADQDLSEVWVDEACEVIGELLGRLHVAAPPQVERLGPYLQPHLERMSRRPAVPRRISQRTAGLARELFSDDVPARLLHTDLHFENVLRRRDGAWVAIDPKPVAGHPGFDVLPGAAQPGRRARHRRGVPLVGAPPGRARGRRRRHRRRRGPRCGRCCAPGSR